MTTLEVERTNLIAAGRQLIEGAKAAHRDLTVAEQDQCDRTVERVKQINQQIKAARESEAASLVKQFAALGAPDHDLDGAVRGAGLLTPEAQRGLVGAIKSRTSYRAEVPSKAALTVGGVGGLVPPAPGIVQEGLHPGSQFPIASLFPNVAAEGPVQRYYRMGAGTAAVVAEGALKPDAGITITPVDLALTKIAALAQYTDEMAEDAPFLVAHLGTELQAAVLAAENASVLGTFTATSGVLVSTGAATTVVDLIADAISGQEAMSGKSPTAVIAHPTVVATVRKAKTSGDGGYVVDPLTAGPPSLHGVPVISSPAASASVVWVVEYSGVIVYRRGPITVEVGHTADDWSRNSKTARAEERFATAVLRPSALTKLTLT